MFKLYCVKVKSCQGVAVGTCQVKLNRGVIDSFNLIYGQAAAGESSKSCRFVPRIDVELKDRCHNRP